MHTPLQNETICTFSTTMLLDKWVRSVFKCVFYWEINVGKLTSRTKSLLKYITALCLII